MRFQNRLRKLEDEYAIVNMPVVRITESESMVRLRDGREMPYEEYKRQRESGELRKFYIDDMVKKAVFKNTTIVMNGSCKSTDESGQKQE